MSRKTLARIVYGAKLFGLATEDSDDDFVSIVVPSARDILLLRDNKITLKGTTGDNHKPNSNSDTDEKQIPFNVFVEGLKKGILECLEVLNAPLSSHLIEAHPIFLELRKNRVDIASNNTNKILGFCKAQSISYSPNADRLQAAKEVHSVLMARGVTRSTKDKFANYMEDILNTCSSDLVKEISIIDIHKNNIRYIDMCGKKIEETVSASLALEIVTTSFKKFESLVQKGNQKNKHDWKSLSHAMRIAQEGHEYVSTGQITIPAKNTDLLLNVKLGKIPLDEVSSMVDKEISNFEAAIETSPLPLLPNEDYIDEFVCRAHMQQILEASPIDIKNFKC